MTPCPSRRGIRGNGRSARDVPRFRRLPARLRRGCAARRNAPPLRRAHGHLPRLRAVPPALHGDHQGRAAGDGGGPPRRRSRRARERHPEGADGAERSRDPWTSQQFIEDGFVRIPRAFPRESRRRGPRHPVARHRLRSERRVHVDPPCDPPRDVRAGTLRRRREHACPARCVRRARRTGTLAAARQPGHLPGALPVAGRSRRRRLARRRELRLRRIPISSNGA